MKSKKLFATTFCVVLIASARAHGACSNATLEGNYGFTITGVNSSLTLAATVGQITADGKGGLSGVQTTSDDGVIASNVTASGSYAIKSNCTGTASITPNGGSASNYAIIVDSAGKQIEMVEIDKGFTESGYALAQGKATCSLAGIKGAYGLHGGGFDSSTVPYSFADLIKSDGAGNLTGTETGSVGGTIFSTKLASTYTVDANCTGTTSPKGNGSGHTYFVIVDGGNSAFQIQTDSGLIVTSVVEKN